MARRSGEYSKEPAQELSAPAQRVEKPILSFRGAPQGYLLRGAKRRGNPQSFSCKFAEKRKNCVILEQIATPVCGLARNDRLFRQPCLSLWERWPSAARTERANKKEPPSGGSFSLSINPLYGVSGSFTQGELKGAKPASNKIKCRAKPCLARRAWNEATIFVPQGGTKITTLFQAVERAKGFFDSLSACLTAGAFHVCKIFHRRAARFTAPFSNSTCFFISCAGHSLHKVRLSRRQNK